MRGFLFGLLSVNPSIVLLSLLTLWKVGGAKLSGCSIYGRGLCGGRCSLARYRRDDRVGARKHTPLLRGNIPQGRTEKTKGRRSVRGVSLQLEGHFEVRRRVRGKSGGLSDCFRVAGCPSVLIRNSSPPRSLRWRCISGAFNVIG